MTTHTYDIATDDASQTGIEALTLADALRQFGGIPAEIQTAEDFERWLREAGGYGYIDCDDDRVASV